MPFFPNIQKALQAALAEARKQAAKPLAPGKGMSGTTPQTNQPPKTPTPGKNSSEVILPIRQTPIPQILGGKGLPVYNAVRNEQGIVSAVARAAASSIATVINTLFAGEQDDSCTDYPGWTEAPRIIEFARMEIVGQVFDVREPVCVNNRTFYPGGGSGVFLSDLKQWWLDLSPTEQEIEKALAATNTDRCRSGTPFSPALSFDFVSGWILSEPSASYILEVSDKLRVDPALVAGILMSEMLFDYTSGDQWTDTLARVLGLDSLFPSGGYGYASAHGETREYASAYVQPLIESGTVFPVFPIEHADADWLSTDYGTILTTAVVTRWLVDPYTDQIGVGYTTAADLSAEDMAIIFTAYRAGIRDWSPPSDTYAFKSIYDYQTRLAEQGLPCNAQLALPVMEWAKETFGTGARE